MGKSLEGINVGLVEVVGVVVQQYEDRLRNSMECIRANDTKLKGKQAAIEKEVHDDLVILGRKYNLYSSKSGVEILFNSASTQWEMVEGSVEPHPHSLIKVDIINVDSICNRLIGYKTFIHAIPDGAMEQRELLLSEINEGQLKLKQLQEQLDDIGYKERQVRSRICMLMLDGNVKYSEIIEDYELQALIKN